MFNKYRMLFVLFAGLCLGILLMLSDASAQSSEKLEIDPDIRAIHIGSAPQDILIGSRKKGERFQYKWDIKGPGKFEGDVTNPAIYYIPPSKIGKKLVQTLITVTVTDNKGKETTDSVIFTLLDPISQIKQEDFNLIVETDKNQYKIGEQMTIIVKTDKDCYVWLFIQDADGNMGQIFPNEWVQDNFIEAGQEIKIPQSEYDFKITMAEPTGRETLIAIAYVEDPDRRGKGVTLEPPTNAISEAIVNYEIIR